MNNGVKQVLAHKYQIYPTEDQKVFKTFGCKRVIYNYYLNEQQRRHENKEKLLSYYDINKNTTKLKETKEWLCEVDSIALQSAAKDLTAAYENFFESVSGKRKGPKISPPKFKSKKSRQLYRTRGIKINENGTLYIPELKEVKAVIHRPIPENSIIWSWEWARCTIVVQQLT